jgi:MraZ protein
MFRGTHEAKVDEKGRLKLPADFMKLVVEKNYGSQFFITSRDGKVAEVWPMQEWEKEEEKKAALPEDDPAKLAWLEFVNGWGGVAEIDKQDRLMLPRKIRDRFSLVNEEVDVTGFQKYLVVRSQKVAEERLANLLAPKDDSERPMGIEEAKRILAAREAQKS